jgi:hypothetical protein
MRKQCILGICMVLITLGAQGAEDVRIDIMDFENDNWELMWTGGTITESFVDDPSFVDNAPKHQGDFAVYGSFDTSLGAWTQTRLTLSESVDLTGMRELHFWIYLYPDTEPHQSGDYRLRVFAPNGHLLGEPRVPTTGRMASYFAKNRSLHIRK